jgi:hypothetical protein
LPDTFSVAPIQQILSHKSDQTPAEIVLRDLSVAAGSLVGRGVFEMAEAEGDVYYLHPLLREVVSRNSSRQQELEFSPVRRVLFPVGPQKCGP